MLLSPARPVPIEVVKWRQEFDPGLSSLSQLLICPKLSRHCTKHSGCSLARRPGSLQLVILWLLDEKNHGVDPRQRLLSKDEVWTGLHPHLHAPRRRFPGSAAARFTRSASDVVISLILSDEGAEEVSAVAAGAVGEQLFYKSVDLLSALKKRFGHFTCQLTVHGTLEFYKFSS